MLSIKIYSESTFYLYFQMTVMWLNLEFRDDTPQAGMSLHES